MLECIVTKFGGSSLANDEQFKKVRSILELEPTRRYLVPSAPGKRFSGDEKVTDLLYLCHTLKNDGKPFSDEFAKIRERYESIARGLHLKVDISAALQEVEPQKASDKLDRLLAAKAKTLEGDPQKRLKLLKFGLSRGYAYDAVEASLSRIKK